LRDGLAYAIQKLADGADPHAQVLKALQRTSA